MKKKEHIVPGYNMLQRYVYGGNVIFRKSHGLCTAGLQTLSNYPLSGEHLGWLMLMLDEPVKVQPFKDNWENSWLDLWSWWAPSDLSRNPQVREQKPGNKLTEHMVSSKSWRFIHVQFKWSLISWYVWMTGSWIFYFMSYKVSSELALALPFAATVWFFLP